MVNKIFRPFPTVHSSEYQALKLERLRREIKIGIDQVERGEVSDGEAFFDELDKELDD